MQPHVPLVSFVQAAQQRLDQTVQQDISVLKAQYSNMTHLAVSALLPQRELLQPRLVAHAQMEISAKKVVPRHLLMDHIVQMQTTNAQVG